MTQVIVNGLQVGAGYALLALGYTLVFGVMRLLTLAHGQVFMASALLGLLAAESFDLPLFVAGLLAVSIGAGLSALTDVVSFRPVGYEQPIAAAVSTIGFALVIEKGIVALRDSDNAVVAPLDPTDVLTVGTVQISLIQVATLVLALGLMVATSLFLRRSRWGIAMRAFAHDPAAVALLGVPVRRLALRTLAVAGGLAGLAGFLHAMRIGSMSPRSGFEVGLIGLAVMTIGGLGSVRGAVVAGLSLGVVVNVLEYKVFWGFHAGVPWILLILVLLVRPHGLFGEAET